MAYRVTKKHRAAAHTDLIEPDQSLPKACIIGAGSSGLAAAKSLYEAGVPFDCFEQGNDIGGNWRIDNSNGQSACYETLEINTSCPRMAFSDFPMPDDYPPYASHDQVHAYFESYVDHFGFRDTITFGTRVELVTRTESGQWDVTFRDTAGTHDSETRRYDAVLVANGHHWDARWPDPAYPGDFAGEQIHAHDYRDGSTLDGRDVVVVGAGNSAMDIAVEASRRARNTTLSIRRGQWVMKKLLGPIALDQLALPGWAPWWTTSLRLRIGALTSGGLSSYGLPKPPHAPGQSHPVQSQTIRKRLRAGAITVKPAIERLDSDGVVFVDGSKAPADLIVWATGYRVTFPFFDPDFLSAPDNDLPLWHRVVHPDHAGLFFIGLLQPVGAVMPLAEAQSRLVAELLAGRYELPSAATMRTETKRSHDAYRRRFYDSARHTMEVDFDAFLWNIHKELKRGRVRAARGVNAVKPAGRGRSENTRLVAAVTGGAQGIGLAIARDLVDAGYQVAIGDIDEVAAKSAANSLGTKAVGHALDVTSSESMTAFIDKVEAQWGELDLFVSNAGVMWVGNFAEEPERAMHAQVEVNLLGTIIGVKEMAPRMKARRSGQIITIASAASVLPTPGEATYGATKHGVLGYLKAVRAELRGSGVRVTSIMPAVVNTKLAEGTATGAAKLLSPDDVSKAVIKSIGSRRFELTIPGYVGPLAALANLLPQAGRDLMMRLMVPDQTRSVDKQARDQYEGQFGPS